MINRREIIIGLSILPIIPYINTKYKTPDGLEPYEKLTNIGWEEYPFDKIKSKDIVRKQKYPNLHYKVADIYPYSTLNKIPGIIVDIIE